MSGRTSESITESTLKNTVESTPESGVQISFYKPLWSLESTHITQRKCQGAPMSLGRADTIFLPNSNIFSRKVKLTTKFDQQSVQ